MDRVWCAWEGISSQELCFTAFSIFLIFRWTSWPWSFIWQKYTFSKGGCVLKEGFFSSSIFETWTWIPLFKTCPVWVLVCISCFRFNWMLKLLQKLYTMGFRLISHEVDSAVNLHTSYLSRNNLLWYFRLKTVFCSYCGRCVWLSNWPPQIGIAYNDYYSYCEVLLMKDNVWSSLDDSNVLWLLPNSACYFK